MSIDCVVLDLDGTLTDLPREAPAFSAAFPALLGEALGRDLSDVWPEAEARVRAASPELGWIVDGHAVGPADADPYVLASSAAQIVLDRLDVSAGSPAARRELVGSVFRRAYQRTEGAFRPEAKGVIEGLLARVPSVHVVTNAATEVALRKLAALAPQGLSRLRVRGDAGKFAIGPAASPDPRFSSLPRQIRLPGLARPVLLERGRYFDALASIWAAGAAGPRSTLVCGDIFEVDLALPAALGAEVHLVLRERTFDYEREAVKALGARGAVSEGVSALLDRIS